MVGGCGAAGEPPRVMVIESDPILRALIVRLLEGSGFRPLPGGREAIGSSGPAVADVLVIDADDLVGAGLPVLAMPAVVLTSAFETPPAPAERRAVVVKPFQNDDLLGIIRSLSGRSAPPG